MKSLLILTLSVAALAADFRITLPAGRTTEAVDGRLLLLLSNDPSKEPRFQISNAPDSQLVFGVDVEGWKGGETRTVGAQAFGYPIRILRKVPAGEYTVQAVLHRYETFRRSDGHAVKLPMDRGEGQHWNEAPGNLYSAPSSVRFDPAAAGAIAIKLEREIPAIVAPQDTKFVKHVRIQSDALTKFWGRPMFIGAHVLLPLGFDEHPQAHYPLMIYHGHFPADLSGFRTEPPDPNLKPDFSARFQVSGYNRIQQEEAYRFYQHWTSANFPRFLVVEIQHANPYYDDSYAVDSANLGPYGEAINRELIPQIEKQFRGIGQGWARFLYGGSTGGWESLATQIFYPDDYNGTFAACPDPIDFRAYTVNDIYKDKNAYYLEGAHKRVPRPGMRNYLGHTTTLLEDMNDLELALGSHGRSGEQFDIWQAVYGPVGKDGYPKPIWDKLTGAIDPQVATYWRDHYDLGYILRRDWPTLGPKLRGKIHIYCGSGDNYFLNDAVYLVEDFLKSTTDPPYEGEVKYGDRAEHCWNGDPTQPNHISRLRYNEMYLPKILEQIQKTAPAGADLTSWRY